MELQAKEEGNKLGKGPENTHGLMKSCPKSRINSIIQKTSFLTQTCPKIPKLVDLKNDP